MKITTARTKFEFDAEERKALETVGNLIDLIYNAMREDNTFLSVAEYEMRDMTEFFERFEEALNKNANVIELY